jgi:hypothetical protein
MKAEDRPNVADVFIGIGSQPTIKGKITTAHCFNMRNMVANMAEH